jgi:hypothetical protein
MRYRLSYRQYAILVGLFILIFAWILVDQFFFSLVIQRFIALSAVALSAIAAFFFIVKPSEPFRLANHLGALLGVLALVLAVIEHVVIRFDFSIRALLICVIAFVCPFPAALIYRLVKPAVSR